MSIQKHNGANYVFSSGLVQFLDAVHDERRYLVIDADEFMKPTRAAFAEFAKAIETSVDVWSVDAEELRRSLRECYSGPPPVIPILHRVPELAPDEVPRVVAKRRAVAIFGPKRGRWK